MVKQSDLAKVTIQIYRQGNQFGDAYDVIPHASGVLLEMNDIGYLISAAHNFDQENLKKIGFLTKKWAQAVLPVHMLKWDKAKC